MQVTDVCIVLLADGPADHLASASIELDGCLMIRGLRVASHEGRLWVLMPTVKGTFVPAAGPKTEQLARHITDSVLAAYRFALARQADDFPAAATREERERDIWKCIRYHEAMTSRKPGSSGS